MQVRSISFHALDDFQLAHDRGMSVKLSSFRSEFAAVGSLEDDRARIAFYAQDGNDYAVVDTGEGAYLIAVTNRDDGRADFIAFQEFATVRDAIFAVAEISATDYE